MPIQKGQVMNPTGRGGFADRPDDINRGGLTKEQAARIQRNGDMAQRAQEAYLTAMLEVMDKQSVEDRVNTLDRNKLTLMQDAMDRAWGKAKQSVDLSSEDGSMTPKGMDAFYSKLEGDE